MDYERGLELLKQLARGTEWYEDILPHETALLDRLHDERLYGPAPQTHQELMRSVDQLNRLSFKHLHISFNDLCLGKLPPLPTTPAKEENGSTSSLPSNRSMTTPTSTRTGVFISYSHKDKRYMQELRTHLAHFALAGSINFWDDTMIVPGSNWREEIEKALQSAKVVVLLISADYLASDFIANTELSLILAAVKKEGVTILPVILRPCAFTDSKLAQFQTVNPPTNPLSSMTPAKREEMWLKIARLVKDLSKPQS